MSGCYHGREVGRCPDCAADAAIAAERRREAVTEQEKYADAEPPKWCVAGTVVLHKEARQKARIQRVYYNGELKHWRVVLAGGTEFVDQSRYPGARYVPNAMPLAAFLVHWEHERKGKKA